MIQHSPFHISTIKKKTFIPYSIKIIIKKRTLTTSRPRTFLFAGRSWAAWAASPRSCQPQACWPTPSHYASPIRPSTTRAATPAARPPAAAAPTSPRRVHGARTRWPATRTPTRRRCLGSIDCHRRTWPDSRHRSPSMAHLCIRCYLPASTSGLSSQRICRPRITSEWWVDCIQL